MWIGTSLNYIWIEKELSYLIYPIKYEMKTSYEIEKGDSEINRKNFEQIFNYALHRNDVEVENLDLINQLLDLNVLEIKVNPSKNMYNMRDIHFLSKIREFEQSIEIEYSLIPYFKKHKNAEKKLITLNFTEEDNLFEFIYFENHSINSCMNCYEKVVKSNYASLKMIQNDYENIISNIDESEKEKLLQRFNLYIQSISQIKDGLKNNRYSKWLFKKNSVHNIKDYYFCLPNCKEGFHNE